MARDTWLAMQQPFRIIEYDDEQAFWDGSSYGPVARIVANPFAHHYYSTAAAIKKVANGVLVAVVDVDGGTVSEPYRRLGLMQGRNCVWLVKADNQDVLIGMVTEAAADSSCPRGQTRRATLNVREAGRPVETFNVARFTEDTDGRPLIGVKCNNVWCDLHPDNTTPAEPHNGQLPHDHPGWRNKSRHDEQVLSYKMQQNGPLVRAMRASIVPHDDLGRKTFAHFEGGVHAASIWLDSPPPAGSKYAAAGLKAGENQIWIYLAQDGTWTGWRRDRGQTTGGNQLPVTWRPHDPTHKPLARARWQWDQNDENGWIECDAGCCEVRFGRE